jgi:hypothetical protein
VLYLGLSNKNYKDLTYPEVTDLGELILRRKIVFAFMDLAHRCMSLMSLGM